MSNVTDITELRRITGLGLLDCKKAIEEANGNMEQAITILRKKSNTRVIAIGARSTKEGRIESYIHVGSKVGVLIEVNCETDFVANTDEFKGLCKDLCLQIAAGNPMYVTRSEISVADIAKEKEILFEQLEGSNKPQQAKEAIVEGRLEKYFSALCLVDQPFVRDASKTINDIIAERITKLGEKIIVKRFVRYQLGT